MYKIPLLLLLFCFFACSEKKSTGDKYPDLLNEAVDTFGYSQFVDSIKYIPLETTSACLIGDITDARITSEGIFILDRQMQTVWIFTSQGEYVDNIFKKGSGPGEYMNLHQFEYDEQKHQIVLLDMWNHALLFYTIKGEYVRSVELDVKAIDFKIVPSGGFVVSQAGADTEDAGVYYVDDSGKMIRKLVGRSGKHLIYLDSNWELCSTSDYISFMSPNFSNMVYHFHGRNLNVEYAFQMKPDLKNESDANISLEHLEDFIRTEFIEGDRWIYATYWSSVHGTRYFLYSKKTNEYWIGKYLKNDLDGIQCSGKTSISQENVFAFWCVEEEKELNPVIQVLYLKE